MNIIYYHQHFSTPNGSAGIRSYEMAKRLKLRGHNVSIVCGSYRGGDTGLKGAFKNGTRFGYVEGIKVIEFDIKYSNSDRFAKRIFNFLNYARLSTKIVFTEKCDLVFATSTPLTAGIPGILARWFCGKIFIFEVRDLWPELPRAMGVIRNPVIIFAMELLEYFCYRSAHRIIGLSPGIVQGIRDHGVLGEKIAMIPNGCDLTIFNDQIKPWRPEGILPDEFLAVFAGTHGLANGLDSVLEAAAVLKRRGVSGIKILLIGQGGQKIKLQERVRRDMLDNVVFHDPVNKAQLARIFASADLGLQVLSNVEAFYNGTSPNKFFDYISAGLPVLINYPGWLAEILQEEKCGFVVAADDPVAFADNLELAKGMGVKLQEMGERAFALAKRDFCRDKLGIMWVEWVIGI